MATLQQKVEAEHTFRSLVLDEGLPEPDHISYGDDCIRAMWRESKVCVVIDLVPGDTRPPAMGLDIEALSEDLRGED